MIRLSREEFESVVSDALDALPVRFAKLIENVFITIEEEPSEDDLENADDDDSELLGIYRGTALTDRMSEAPLLPDEIALFRRPINRVARSREEAVEEIRKTVIHEIGHYFGLGDEELP